MPSIDTDALDRALARIRPETIDAHLRFLAHPLLEGRAPGTRGGTLAMEYIRAPVPAHRAASRAGGSYLQEVPMVGLTPAPTLAFQTPQGAMEPRYEDEYVLEAGVPETAVEVDAPLVFAGFGIAAPEWSWDDFKDVDVRGKVLLVRVNDPGTEATPDFFGGRALTYYGRWTYKFEEASRRGAAGAHPHPHGRVRGLPVARGADLQHRAAVRPGRRRRSSRCRSAGGSANPSRATCWPAPGTSTRRSSASRTRRGSARWTRESASARPSAARWSPCARPTWSACCRGATPAHAEEPVILSSHYDHLGVRQAADGTRVHPPRRLRQRQRRRAAADRGGGGRVAAGRARRARCSSWRRRRRSRGCWGRSGTRATRSFPCASTAAALNVDGANLQGRTRDLTPLGADRSTLGDAVRAAAEAEGMAINPDPHPEQGMFYRQDHFPLARSGVPALALDHGLAFEGRPEGWGQQWYDEFVTRHYHQPSDSYAEGWDYGGAVQQGRVMLRTALAAAAAPEIAAWHARGRLCPPL